MSLPFIIAFGVAYIIWLHLYEGDPSKDARTASEAQVRAVNRVLNR